MTNFASCRNFSDIISQLNLKDLVQLCNCGRDIWEVRWWGYCVQAWLQGIMDWEAGTSRDPHFNPQNPWYDRAGGGKWDLTWSRILGPAGKTLLDPTQLEQVESTLNWTSDQEISLNAAQIIHVAFCSVFHYAHVYRKCQLFSAPNCCCGKISLAEWCSSSPKVTPSSLHCYFNTKPPNKTFLIAASPHCYFVLLRLNLDCNFNTSLFPLSYSWIHINLPIQYIDLSRPNPL